MTMMQDGFCGNCGFARPPQVRVCPRCGRPFEAPEASLNRSSSPLQGPTQVASTPPQSFWQSSSPTYYAGTPPPPVPASRWTARLLIAQGIIVVVLLAVILVLLLHPFAGGNSTQSGAPTLTPAPATSTATPAPAYVSGLSSSDPKVFARALGDALQAYDGASIFPHVLTSGFVIICNQNLGFPGQCDTSWSQVQEQITSQKLLIDILTQGLILQENATPAADCPGLPNVRTFLVVQGSFEQETGMPLSHLGGAILGISSSGGSALHPALYWSAIYFC